MHPKLSPRLSVVLLALLFTAHTQAQERPPIAIRTTQISQDVYMLQGAGGNLALLVGGDGALLVDSEYKELTEKVVAAVKAVRDEPIRVVINTHWHFDHVGGNAALGGGGGADRRPRQRSRTHEQRPAHRSYRRRCPGVAGRGLAGVHVQRRADAALERRRRARLSRRPGTHRRRQHRSLSQGQRPARWRPVLQRGLSLHRRECRRVRRWADQRTRSGDQAGKRGYPGHPRPRPALWPRRHGGSIGRCW